MSNSNNSFCLFCFFKKNVQRTSSLPPLRQPTFFVYACSNRVTTLDLTCIQMHNLESSGPCLYTCMNQPDHRPKNTYITSGRSSTYPSKGVCVGVCLEKDFLFATCRNKKTFSPPNPTTDKLFFQHTQLSLPPISTGKKVEPLQVQSTNPSGIQHKIVLIDSTHTKLNNR